MAVFYECGAMFNGMQKGIVDGGRARGVEVERG